VMWPDRLVGRHIIVPRRNNSAHLHRPWRAIPSPEQKWAPQAGFICAAKTS
jgi:hypothetical protein